MPRAARKPSPASILRPMPPRALITGDPEQLRFEPAPEVKAWFEKHILARDGALHNPDHAHLDGADLEFLWASGGFVKQSRRVLGMCELVAFRAGPWQSGRQEQQMREWFGRVPKFLITLDAAYCACCTAVEWCMLLEHECFHIGQTLDAFGDPALDKDGNPKLAIRGHDVEEFIGIVRRYGPTEEVKKMIEIARNAPEVASHSIAQACGTCLRGVAG